MQLKRLFAVFLGPTSATYVGFEACCLQKGQTTQTRLFKAIFSHFHIDMMLKENTQTVLHID